ncbi:MAG: GNAT family N-acetyltransferase [Candidatus Acidiferrales bacterium]
MPAAPHVRIASLSDVEGVVAVLREAAQWLADGGIPLWTPQSFTPESLRTHIERAEVVIAECLKEIVAVALRLWEDPVIWPDRKPGEAGYIHKLSVKRSYARQGLSERLVAWIAQDAQLNHRRYLRLDCAPRPALVSLYGRLGFRRVDERTIGPFLAVRFEKLLAE